MQYNKLSATAYKIIIQKTQSHNKRLIKIMRYEKNAIKEVFFCLQLFMLEK